MKKALHSGDSLLSLIPHEAHWAIYEPSARQLLASLQGTSINVHMQEIEARGPSGSQSDRSYQLQDGIAYISICGVMLKAPTSMDDGCSTVYIRNQIRQAARDPEVKGAILKIDSPGGSVSGTESLAEDVAAFARKKPIFGAIDDLCASAALWVTSQCTRVYANPTALVGSIGTVLAIADWSKMYDAAGVEVLVFSTGPYKGAGVQGAPITEAQRADFQSLVDSLNTHFLGAVSRGRNMDLSSVQAVATGQVWLASEALALGLIDQIGGWDDAIADLMQETRGSRAAGARAEDTAIESISGEAAPLGGQSLAEESEAALAAVRGLTTRIAGLKAIRESENRELSQSARAHLETNLAALQELETEICLALARPADSARRKALSDAVRRANLAAAIS